MEQAERVKEKEAKKQRNLEITRQAQEAKLKRKAEQAEKMALLEQELIKKREQSRLAKEANTEKMRQAQEAKKIRDQEKQAKYEAQQKIEEENARQRADTTVLVSLDQQALLDQIRLIAEKSAGEGTGLAKLNLVSVGNTSQVKMVFDTAEQAKAFLAAKPEKHDLLVKMENARPLAGAKRTCYFGFDHEPHGDRATAQAAVLAALKKAKLKFTHATLKGALFVVEFASEQECERSCKVLLKGTCFLGAGKTKTVLGADALVGNPPRRPNKKRNLSAMQLS